MPPSIWLWSERRRDPATRSSWPIGQAKQQHETINHCQDQLAASERTDSRTDRRTVCVRVPVPVRVCAAVAVAGAVVAALGLAPRATVLRQSNGASIANILSRLFG